jgi:glutathione S-transferase
MKFQLFTLTALSTLFSSFALAAPSSLELKYFDVRGAIETARIILALGKHEYKDTRYTLTLGSMEAPEFKEAKESGALDANLGRAPLLVVDDSHIIGQSKVIERYLAKKCGLMGSSDIEEAQIECIAEHCRDIKDAAAKKGFSFFSRDKTDEEKAAAKKEWFEEEMPTMLGKLEKAIQIYSGGDGFAFGTSTSYADVAIFSLLKDCIQEEAEATWKAAANCPSLLAVAEKIASDEGVSKWVADRPVTMF